MGFQTISIRDASIADGGFYLLCPNTGPFMNSLKLEMSLHEAVLSFIESDFHINNVYFSNINIKIYNTIIQNVF